jgi:hypothetical protein
MRSGRNFPFNYWRGGGVEPPVIESQGGRGLGRGPFRVTTVLRIGNICREASESNRGVF